MKLTILGCYSATPRRLTNPTSQVLEAAGKLFLIDCGEGTQVQLRRQKVKFSRIQHIFISHLHGDHFFGLPGLISTFRLLGRETELHIYGPRGLKEAITLLLRLGDSWTNYPLVFHELESRKPQVLLETERLRISTLPLKHRVYTNGFLFEEFYPERRLNIEKVREYHIPKTLYAGIKSGLDYPLEDRVIPNEDLTYPPSPPMRYAFCSDTAYHEELIPLIQGVDCLYHESTFLESESHLCERTGHSTALQAGRMARLADVSSLILGHYSTRYKHSEVFLKEARQEFSPVVLAEDGLELDLLTLSGRKKARIS